MLCLDVCIVTTTMPQPTEITQFIFGKPLREAQPKTSSSVTLPLHPNGRAQSGACIQSITVSGRIERVADTGKPKPSTHRLRAIESDLEVIMEASLRFRPEGICSLRPLYIIAASAGLVIARIELLRRVCL